MNNAFLFGLIAAGGLYIYSESRKKKATSTSAEQLYGTRLIYKDGKCAGYENVPGRSDAQVTADTIALNDIFQKTAIAYFVQQDGPPYSQDQVDGGLVAMLSQIWPDCDWATLPDSTPIGESTIGELRVVLKQLADSIPTPALGAVPQPLPTIPAFWI